MVFSVVVLESPVEPIAVPEDGLSLSAFFQTGRKEGRKKILMSRKKKEARNF